MNLIKLFVYEKSYNYIFFSLNFSLVLIKLFVYEKSYNYILFFKFLPCPQILLACAHILPLPHLPHLRLSITSTAKFSHAQRALEEIPNSFRKPK